jgi:lysophospholipase L1-like esterase
MTLVASRRRAALAVGLLVALLGSVIAPMGTEPARAAGSFHVLITGDSITQGSSGDYTWRYRLWNKLADTAPGEVTFVGPRTDLFDDVNNVQGSQYYAAGFGAKAHGALWGDSFQNELGNIGGVVSSSGANVLVVMLGSNDLAYLTSPAATIANLKTYIAQARGAHPGIDIVVGEVLNRYDPWSGSYLITPQVDEYASLLASAASQLDTSGERVVVAPTRTGWDARTMTWDGTHPNPTGEALIAQRISQGLTRIGVGTSGSDISGPRSWDVAGPAVGLTSGSEQVDLSWSRTSTGANGMFIEQRLVNTGEPWQRLQYAVAGNGWTAGMLAAGGTYQYRIVPAKGSSTGIAGPAAQAVAAGPPLGAIDTVTGAAGGASSYGGQRASVSWTTSTNATAYTLSYRELSDGSMSWTNLPYPVTQRAWTFEPLYQGRRYDFRILPSRGYLDGEWATSGVVRTNGWPADSAQVSLGDSYSSGLGSDAGYYGSYSCLRSDQAWPNQIFSDFRSALSLQACPGAEVPDVRGQLAGMTTFFAAHPGQPQLVTLTVGGNDIGFADELAKCAYDDCSGDESYFEGMIAGLESSLTSLYSSIKAAQPFADIIVGGYPDVVERSGDSENLGCIELQGGERDMIARLSQDLNAVISSAAHGAGVWSVGQGVRNEFAGHNACEGGIDEWINPVIFGVQPDGGPPVDPRSFHPNDSGQSGYAIAFTNALNGYMG